MKTIPGMNYNKHDKDTIFLSFCQRNVPRKSASIPLQTDIHAYKKQRKNEIRMKGLSDVMYMPVAVGGKDILMETRRDSAEPGEAGSHAVVQLAASVSHPVMARDQHAATRDAAATW